MYTIQRFDSPNWVSLGSIAGLGESSYVYEATTLIDSLGQGNDSTSFRVIALNFVLDYTFYSDEYNGQLLTIYLRGPCCIFRKFSGSC